MTVHVNQKRLYPQFSTLPSGLVTVNVRDQVCHLQSQSQGLEGSVETRGLCFRPPDCECELIGRLNIILPSTVTLARFGGES